MLLTRCPCCGGRLIYPSRLWMLDDVDCAVERRCPDCEHVDRVRTRRAAMGAWARREEHARVELARLAGRSDAGAVVAAVCLPDAA